VSSKPEKEQVYARYVASGKTVQHLASWGKRLAEVMNPEGKPEVLDDILVLDASDANFSGIIAASFFAEFGAEVIKIEPPDGDPARRMTLLGENVNGVGIPFLIEGRNKRYMTLDLRNSEKDRNDFARLAEKAAVVIETFGAGEMDSWGIGYRQLSQKNPGIIYIAITPYGQYTEKAQQFAHFPDSDITSQAGSGLPAQVGDPANSPEPYNWPLKAGMWAGWYISGLHAALGGSFALVHRQNTGEGQMVDVATMDAYSCMVGFPPTIGYTWESSRPRIGVLDFILYPYGLWRCKDGYVVIAAPRDHDFRALLKILGLWKLEDDWRFTPDRIPDVVDTAMVLYKAIEEKTILYTADELVNKALRYSAKAARSKWRGGGVPIVMKMNTPPMTLESKQFAIRRIFQEVEDGTLGKFVINTGFVKMSESPPRVKWVSCDIGKDNEYIRKRYLQER
jgi:crotonobetainyl-CoA:carnitine CoA-transferase CaiB-like acyl-CoA transferase